MLIFALAIRNKDCSKEGSLAQLVQSVCLTSRGSGVRIPQLPQDKSKKPLLSGFFTFIHFPFMTANKQL